MERRDFLLGLLPSPMKSWLGMEQAEGKGHDPRRAALEWLRQAGCGLFMHYGVYSLLGRGEWVQLRDLIPVREYEKLKDKLTADKFDADKITDLALAAGMKYITITTQQHGSFRLFKTAERDFNSLNSPARRDLIAELTQACRKKRLAIFYYYSYAPAWRHPYFYSREYGLASSNDPWSGARPAYKEPEPS
jgi:alpha-L-fucosidase